MLLASISGCHRTILEYELDLYDSRFQCGIPHNVVRKTLLYCHDTIRFHVHPLQRSLARTSFFFNMFPIANTTHHLQRFPLAAFKEPDLLLFSSQENSVQGRQYYANTCRGKRTVYFYGYKWLSLVVQNNHPHFLQFSGHA